MSKQVNYDAPPLPPRDCENYPVYILSMNAKCVEAVTKGTRCWDFRDKSCKEAFGKKTLLFAGPPVNQIVGRINIWEEVIGSPSKVWKTIEKEPKRIDITEDEFYDLLDGVSPVYAQKIESVWPLDMEGPTLDDIKKESIRRTGKPWHVPETCVKAYWASNKFWGIK